LLLERGIESHCLKKQKSSSSLPHQAQHPWLDYALPDKPEKMKIDNRII
jgi:hypothetical protein